MLQPADTMKATLLFLLLLSVCQTSVHSRASVTVTPNKSQFVDYDKVSVSCEQMSSGEWTTWRCTTKSKTVTQCGVGWGKQNSSTCVINSVKQTDSGVYWCQSKQGESSNTVNITVIGGPVILRSPVLPVMEGHDVTLSCRTTTSSNLPAGFYKDGSFIRTEPEGHMTIQHVTKSDEGLYRCNMTGGESPPSWLFVKDPRGSASSAADSAPSVLGVIRHLLVFSPYCISTVLMVSVYRNRPSGKNQPVAMTMFPPSEDDEELDQPYDDLIADVTTQHHF